MFEESNSVAITPIRNAHSGSYSNYLGTYESPAALKTAYPVGNEGDYADVTSTGSIWVWSDKANNWVDSGDPGLLFEVR